MGCPPTTQSIADVLSVGYEHRLFDWGKTQVLSTGRITLLVDYDGGYYHKHPDSQDRDARKTNEILRTNPEVCVLRIREGQASGDLIGLDTSLSNRYLIVHVGKYGRATARMADMMHKIWNAVSELSDDHRIKRWFDTQFETRTKELSTKRGAERYRTVAKDVVGNMKLKLQREYDSLVSLTGPKVGRRIYETPGAKNIMREVGTSHLVHLVTRFQRKLNMTDDELVSSIRGSVIPRLESEAFVEKLLAFKERSGVDTAQFVTLCGNGCFYARVESEAFIEEFESFMSTNSMPMKLFMTIVSDSGGSIYSLWKHRQQFAHLYNKKRKRDSKRNECRRFIKRLKRE